MIELHWAIHADDGTPVLPDWVRPNWMAGKCYWIKYNRLGLSRLNLLQFGRDIKYGIQDEVKKVITNIKDKINIIVDEMDIDPEYSGLLYIDSEGIPPDANLVGKWGKRNGSVNLETDEDKELYNIAVKRVYNFIFNYFGKLLPNAKIGFHNIPVTGSWKDPNDKTPIADLSWLYGNYSVNMMKAYVPKDITQNEGGATYKEMYEWYRDLIDVGHNLLPDKDIYLMVWHQHMGSKNFIQTSVMDAIIQAALDGQAKGICVIGGNNPYDRDPVGYTAWAKYAIDDIVNKYLNVE